MHKGFNAVVRYQIMHVIGSYYVDIATVVACGTGTEPYIDGLEIDTDSLKL